jgi:hypothetical protein
VSRGCGSVDRVVVGGVASLTSVLGSVCPGDMMMDGVPPARGCGRSVFQGRPRATGARDLTVLLVGAGRGMKVIGMMMAPTVTPRGVSTRSPVSWPPPGQAAVVVTAAAVGSAGWKASSPSSPRM